jgi:hypothetical protein
MFRRIRPAQLSAITPAGSGRSAAAGEGRGSTHAFGLRAYHRGHRLSGRSYQRRRRDRPAPGSHPIYGSPIYRQLLAELEAPRQAAGQCYDRLADPRLIDQAERFDWRSYRSPSG